MTIGFDEAGPDHAGITFGPVTCYPSTGPDGPDLRAAMMVSVPGLAVAAARAAVGCVNSAAFAGTAAGTVLVTGFTDSAATVHLMLAWRSRPWNAGPWPGPPPYPEVDLARLLGLEPPAPAPHPEDRPMAEVATMLDLWDQCEATGEGHALLGVDFYASMREPLRATGPIYRRRLDFDCGPIITWLGIDRESGHVQQLTGTAGPVCDARLVPVTMVGDVARDAATVPVPEPEAESWRKRPPLFW